MISKMEQLNEKANGLRRLAELITYATDPRSLIPDISALVPIGSIDIDSYQNLRAQCPFLNLPDGQAGLDILASDLFKSYNSLLDGLKAHPFNQLNKLVDTFDRLVGQAGVDVDCVLRYLQCAQGACSALDEQAATTNRMADVLDTYTRNLTNTTAAVLSDRAKAKVAEYDETVGQVQNLLK